MNEQFVLWTIVISTIVSSLFVSGETTTSRRIGFFISLTTQPVWVYSNYHYHQYAFFVLNVWFVFMCLRGIKNNPYKSPKI